MRGIDEWVHFSNAFLINVLFLLSRLFFFFFFFFDLPNFRDIGRYTCSVSSRVSNSGNSKYSVISEHVVWMHFLLYITSNSFISNY